MQYYEPKQNRLIYLGQEATPAFWDAQWDTQMHDSVGLATIQETFVTKINRRYIKSTDGVILEGGCGRGQHVAALVNNGYQCIGIDSAEQTVQFLHKAAPQLDIRLGDVRALQFEDNSFIGYWSLGVIEHFWDGYSAIAQEMRRVLKPGGYLFLTFPYMSPLRLYKAKIHQYAVYSSAAAPSGFYQFALDHQRVLKDFTDLGFACVQTLPQGGVLGIKNEATLLKNKFRQLYDYQGKSRVVRGSRYLLEQLALPIAGHSILLILQRTDS